MKKWEILNKWKMPACLPAQASAGRENGKCPASAGSRLWREKMENIIKVLLRNRGLTKKKEIEEFLHPDLKQLMIDHSGLDKKELHKAVERIKKAIEGKESVIVYGDYDADGVCSTAIVWETLYNSGAKAMPYIPHREKEGYGLSKQGIDLVKKQYSASLMIAVDHGVSEKEKIKYAEKLGIETIILDHHLLPEKLPDVVALIHTTKLTSGGIAWLFCNYLTTKLCRSTSKPKSRQSSLDLACLATIADLVPLLGANRVIVKYGLEQMNKTERVGLNALIKAAGLTKGEIGTYEVGYILAPRINAMGRLTHALESLRLICTNDREKAWELANKLNFTNRERQILTQQATEMAIQDVNNNLRVYREVNKKKQKMIFIDSEYYHQGIIGLVAGRLVEEFYRPAIVIARGEKYSKASARSVSGFNIVELIRKADDLLVDVGGHPMAAGFTVATKNIKILREKLLNMADSELSEEKLVKTIKIDLELDLADINEELYSRISSFSPYGIGNPEPVFATFGVKVVGAKQIGKEGKHLKIIIKDEKTDKIHEAIGFNMGENATHLYRDVPIDIAYNITQNYWNGRHGLQLKLRDVRIPSDSSHPSKR